MAEVFDMTAAAAAGSGPLQQTFPLSPSVTVVTDIYGTARNETTVTIKSGTMPVWLGSMNQVSPVAEIPYELILGSLNIKAGTKFTLTIPTAQQMGNVLMQGEIESPPNPSKPISALVAIWPLVSTT